VIGRKGENFGAEKRWKKIYICGQGGWDFRSSGKQPQRAHPQLVHWWLLVHSSRFFAGFFKNLTLCTTKFRGLVRVFFLLYI
jgi:hypothetical protein